MVRGLVIRQGFLIADTLLGALFLVIAGLIVAKFFQPPATANLLETAPAASGDYQDLVPEVAPLAEYAKIMQSGLFGDAGRQAVEPQAPVVEEVPTEPQITETKLNLRLIGVVATSPTDPFASAIIANNDAGGTSESYGTGEPVVESVFLEEVYPSYVILRNETAAPHRHERLALEGDTAAAEVAEAPTRATRSPRPTAAAQQRITVSRSEITTDIMTNYQELLKIKPEAYLDANGEVVGITAQNISDIPMAAKLGLQDGDVLQELNGEKIDSEQKIMEVMQEHQNAQSFRIGILRNGKPTFLEYNLR